ncbi:MAG: beta-ACP synthase [Bacteroidetes bacterium GWC2_33_15]|nr:MAG: beta-ACP synthase [Bacteroidetes bacterium GWA2_33_15]OFX48742.1 MAG: beta-ACP synthase [Bacteroidetes bacterium GWC2_33_15]OFX65984.1 MAG: beta-ACP synthase [Bacteroidetes bacterium GWB2_32_14]OFX68255.1 MAG: beta-ACP synthase [Bacteroidetes bacterium GWD2_33_33]HAN18035.1 beta-ketoacyl-[acyl-carrier-protein] synthase family protein [Bacteroidales bacterium]
MSKRIFVTGIGIISGIGNNIEETLQSILDGKTGVGKITHLETFHKDTIPVSEVKYSNEELIELMGLNKKDPFTRATLMGIVAADEAVKSAGIKNINDYRTGVISGTTVGGMDKSEQFYHDFLTAGEHIEYIESHDCGDSTERIADYVGVKDFVSTTSTACSSAANSIMFGARLIKNNRLDRVIAGGTESLTKYHLNGFNTLMILDREQCKPFDENRKGLNLGEGAAFVVLESEDIVRETGKKVFCELTGYGNACEAFHQTASTPEGKGAYLAMKKALDRSGLKPEQIDYINAHGTGTENNDISEGRAIETLFGKTPPPVSSTKSFTGHTTSAAGAIEAVLSVLAIQHNLIYPNMNFNQQMKELSFRPVTELLTNVKVDHVLSNSFGFGGNNSALIFSRY